MIIPSANVRLSSGSKAHRSIMNFYVNRDLTAVCPEGDYMKDIKLIVNSLY